MPDIAVIAKRSASSIGRALQAGETSSAALTAYLLDRADGQSSPAFIALTRERALREAREADMRLSAGRPLSPLDGVPIAWKDLIDVEGTVTTAGSEVYRNNAPAARDAPVVVNLALAGMVTLGKLNLTEFAYSGLGLNPHFGTPVNPHGSDAARVPGGSSSGCGVAVASGLVPCAIGTDTGGSIRIPAAFNGITGYKPSEGRILSDGVFALSRTLDTVGPLGRSVEDCVHLDAALRGLVSSPVIRRPLSGLSLFVPETIVLDDVEPVVMANFEKSLRELELRGAVIKRGKLPPLQAAADLTAAHGSLAAADAFVEHRALVESGEGVRVDRRVVDRILGGAKMSAFDLLTLQRARAQLIAALAQTLNGDLIVMPTVAHTAPQIAPLENDRDLFHKVNLKTLRNTMIGNFFNLPGLAIPNGVDRDGMPTSLLVSALGGQDETLLGYGLGVEAALEG